MFYKHFLPLPLAENLRLVLANYIQRFIVLQKIQREKRRKENESYDNSNVFEEKVKISHQRIHQSLTISFCGTK